MVLMELYRTGTLSGMPSLIALIKISTAILTKGCVGRCIRSLTILILPCIQIIQLYDVVMACHPPLAQLDQEKGQREFWKLALSPKNFQICDGHYSDKTNYSLTFNISSVQFSSVAQPCLTLGNPMNCSTPGLPVHHQLPEFTQTHVHRVRDAIQPSHPLSSPSPPAPNPSQHQSIFQ